jgi:sporulation protein YlmC with PRC-barrel domain
LFIIVNISLASAIWVMGGSPVFTGAEHNSTGGSPLTGSTTITGGVTSQNVDLKIYVVFLPSLAILSPRNATYLVNESLLLNYSVSDAENAWYTIDSSSDISLLNFSSYIFFDVSDGSHVLALYANNSYGMTTKSIRFVANSTRFVILYKDEYKTSYSGASTDFYRYTYEEIVNLSDICLENIHYGKICFDSPIDLTNDRINNDDFTNIQGNTNIDFNNLGVNSFELPNFNVSATIWIYNLSFTNPRVLRDGTPCSSAICTVEDYSSGILRFHVTRFSNYSAEEGPVSPTTSAGGGGIKGGYGAPNKTKLICTNATIPNAALCPKCDAPYIMRGDECCLDENNNEICDSDEIQKEMPAPIAFAISWLDLFWIMLIIALLASIISIALVRYLLPLLAGGVIAAGAKRRKHKGELTRLREAKDIMVYSSNGNKLGMVDEVYLQENKVFGWKIMLDENIAKNMEKRAVVVRHKHVRSIKDVMVLDQKSSDYLENFNS